MGFQFMIEIPATFTSTHPVNSLLVDLKVMLVLQGVRSSSIPTEDGVHTEEVPSLERIQPRSIDLLPTHAVGWPSLPSRQGFVSVLASNFYTLSVLLSH